ncbi:unnamed protein product [Lymnaea stagnalis]|uniref:Fibronectin type-III domain-containing protein n=1 Tax=Lymnaea stagnalis TaxID=6523 RepID=A0AAV2IKW3_LYMST
MTSVIVTHNTTPTGTVFNIEPISVQPNSAQLVWQPPLCESKGGLLYKYDIEMAPVTSPMNVLFMSANSEYVSLTDLTPYTRYQIRVRYVNGVGSGPFCPFVVFETTQGPPSAPIIYNFTYDDTTIGVIIVQPVLPNGRIDQYHIQLTGGVHHMSNLYTPLNGTEYVIGNLKPNTTYRIRACARNAAGWGEWSYEIQVVTKFEIKPSPSALRQTFANKTCIGFHWAPPIKDSTAIHSYLVSLSTLDKKLLPISATVNRDSFDHLQCYLSPYTQYSVTVSVVKETGQIGHPLGSRMWTEGMVPPKPRPPVVRTVTTSTITVEIFPVIFDNGPITSYQIRLLRVLHNHTIKDPHPFGENAFQPNVPLSFLDEAGIGAAPKLRPAAGGPPLPQRNQVPIIKPVGKRSIPEFDLPNVNTSPMALEPNDGRIVLWAVAPFSARQCSLKVWFREWKGNLGASKDLVLTHCNKDTVKRTEPLAVGALPKPRPHPRYDTRPGADALGRVSVSSDVTLGKAGEMFGLKSGETGFKGRQQTVGEDPRYGDWRERRAFYGRPRTKRSFGSPPGILWLELSNNDLSEATYVTIGDEKMYYGKRNQALEPDTEYGIVFVVASTVVDVTKHAYVLATTTAFTQRKKEELMTAREKIIILAAVIPALLLLFIIMGFFVIRHLIMAGKEEKRKKASESDDRRKKKNMDDNNDEVDEESNEDYDMPLQVGDSSDFLSRPAKANSKLEQFFNPTKSVGQPRYITTMRDNIMYDDNRNKALSDADDNNSADLRPMVSGQACSLTSSSDLQHVESDCDCDGHPPAHWEYSDNINNNRGGRFASPASTNTTVGSHSSMICPADEESFTRQLLPGGVDIARTSSRCQKDEVIKICINNDGSDGSDGDEADLESSCIDSPPRAYSGVGYALIDPVSPLNGSSDEDQHGMAQSVPFCPNSLQVSRSTTRTPAVPSKSGVVKQRRPEQVALSWDVNNNSRNVDDSFEDADNRACSQGRISPGLNVFTPGTTLTTNIFSSKVWTSDMFQSDTTAIIKPFCDSKDADSEHFQRVGGLLTISLNEKKLCAEIEPRKKDIECIDIDGRKSDLIESFVNDVLKNYSSSSSRCSKRDDNNSNNNKDIRIGSQDCDLSWFHGLPVQDKETTDLDGSAAVDTTACSGSPTSASDIETIALNDPGAEINQCACGGLPDSACSFSKTNFSHLPHSPRPTNRPSNIPAFRLGAGCSSVPGSETMFKSTFICKSSRPFDPISSMDNTPTQSGLSAPSAKRALAVPVNVRDMQRMDEHTVSMDTEQLQNLGLKGRLQSVGYDHRETLSLFSETASSRHPRKAQRVIDTSHSTDFFRWDFQSYNVMVESSDNNCDCLNVDHWQMVDVCEVGAEGVTLDHDFREWEQVMVSDEGTAPYGGPCHECNPVDQNNNSTRRCCCCCCECKEDDKNYPYESESDLDRSLHGLPKISQPTTSDKARQDVKHEKSLEELANYFIANVPTKKSVAYPEKEDAPSKTVVNSNANNNCDSADGNGCLRSPRPTDDGDVKTRRELVGAGGEGGKVRLLRKRGKGTNKEAGKRCGGTTSDSCASDGDVSSREVMSDVTDKDFGILGSANKNVDRKRMQRHWGKHSKGLGNIFKNASKLQCSFGNSCNPNDRVDTAFPISTKKSVSFVFRKKKRRETDATEHACSRAKSGMKEVPCSNNRKGGWAKAKMAEGDLSSNRSPDRALQCRYSAPQGDQSDEESDDDDTDDSENDESVTESGDGESETESEMESEVETCAKSYTTPNKVTRTTPSHPSPQRSSPKTDNPEVETGQQSSGMTEYPNVATPQEAASSKPPKKRWFSFWPFAKKTTEKMKEAKQGDSMPDEKNFDRSNHGKDGVKKRPERSMSDTAVQKNAWSIDKFKKLNGPLLQGSVPGFLPYPITVSPVVYPALTQVTPRYPVLANHIPTCVPQLQPYHVYPRPLMNMNYSRKYEAPPTRERQTPNRHACAY